jgi:hypothetical protein
LGFAFSEKRNLKKAILKNHIEQSESAATQNSAWAGISEKKVFSALTNAS